MAFDATQLVAMSGSAWSITVKVIVIGSALVALFALAHFFVQNKRYNYIVRVFERDSNGHIIEKQQDKGGIFIDKKTQYRLFLLKKNKAGLTPDRIPYILNFKGLKVVNILQSGLKNFQFLKPQVSGNPGIVYDVQDEDVAWALNAYERFKKPFMNQFMERILPFLGMAFVFMMIIVALYFVFDNISVLKDVANAFNQAAQEFAKVQHGTTVVEGGGG